MAPVDTAEGEAEAQRVLVLAVAPQGDAAWLRHRPACIACILAPMLCIARTQSSLQTAVCLHLCLAVILRRRPQVMRLQPLHTGTDASIIGWSSCCKGPLEPDRRGRHAPASDRMEGVLGGNSSCRLFAGWPDYAVHTACAAETLTTSPTKPGTMKCRCTNGKERFRSRAQPTGQLGQSCDAAGLT